VKERIRRWLSHAGYVGFPLFYLLCLVVFAAVTFPFRLLRDRIVATFNAQQRAGGGSYELQVDDFRGSWLTGVRMKGVRLLSAPTDAGKALKTLEIDDATLRYGILAALTGSREVTFDVFAFGGEATGAYATQGKDVSVDVSLDSIELGRVTPLVDLVGVPLKGRLSGTMHLLLPDGAMSKAAGTVSMSAKDVSVGDGKAKLKGQLALPTIDVGPVSFVSEAKGGVLKVSKLLAGGKDLELQGDGRVLLRDPVTDAICDVQIRFKINDAYRGKNDMTSTLFGEPGSTAAPLFELADPRIKQAKRPDGFYGWTMRGALGRADFVPAGGSAGKP
jgi:type II secretion system protein N